MVLTKRKVEHKETAPRMKPFVLRLDDIESELRLISSRVDNSVRVDDKVKLERELAGLRNSVSDFSAKFSGEMEFSSNKLKSEIERVTKSLESEISELSKNARSDLNNRRGEFEENLKRLNSEVIRVSRDMAQEIKELSKDVDVRTNVRFGAIEESLRRLEDEVNGIAKLMSKEIGELEKRVVGNSHVELDKKVAALEKLSDSFVVTEDKVRIERELFRTKENLNGIFVKLSDDVSSVSRKLGVEVEELKKKVKSDMDLLASDLAKISVQDRAAFDSRLKKLEAGVESFSKGFSEDILSLSKRIDNENEEGAKKINSDLIELSSKMDGVLGLEDDVAHLKGEIGQVSLSLEEERVDFAKKLEGKIKGVVADFGVGFEDLQKRIFVRLNVVENDLKDVLSTRDKKKFEEEFAVLREEIKKASGLARVELSGVRDKMHLEFRDFAKKIEREVASLFKEVERNSLLDVNKRVRILEKEKEGFVKVDEMERERVNFAKVRNELEDMSLRTKDELKFAVRRVNESLKDLNAKFEHDVKGLTKRLDANSVVEVSRRVNVLEKELDSVSRGLESEDEGVVALKKDYGDKIFALEREVGKLNERVDEVKVKDVDFEKDRVIEALNVRIRELEVKLGNFEGRVDLENEKIYDRLAESLDLMMFWEKKLARVSDEGLSKKDVRESKVLEKKRANQVGVIRERKKVLERLRRSHASDRLVSVGSKKVKKKKK